MINKRAIHHWWRNIQRLKTWQLLILLAIFSGMSVLMLRQNNLGMIDRRNLVKVADEQEGDVYAALSNLQKYVLGHMNTNMGDKGVYLEKTYQKAYDRAVQNSLRDDTASRSLYEKADQECQAVFNRTYSFPAYTQCVAEKLAGQRANDPVSAANIPTVDLFRHNFISPTWSADIAGMYVLLTGVVLAIIIARIIVIWVLYLLMRKHDN